MRTVLKLGLSVACVAGLVACNEPTRQNPQSSESITVPETETFTRDPKGPSVAGITYERSTPAPQICDLKFSVASEVPSEFYQNTDVKSAFTQDPIVAQCVSGIDTASVQELGRLFFSKSAPKPPWVKNVESTSQRPSRIRINDYLHLSFSFQNIQVARDFASCMAKGWSEFYKQLYGQYGSAVSKYDATEEENRVYAHYNFTAHGISEFVVYLAQVIEISGRSYVVISSAFDKDAGDAEKYTHIGAKEDCKGK